MAQLQWAPGRRPAAGRSNHPAARVADKRMSFAGHDKTQSVSVVVQHQSPKRKRGMLHSSPALRALMLRDNASLKNDGPGSYNVEGAATQSA